MNKFINALLLFFALPTMLFTIAVGFDFPISFLGTTGANIPFRFEIFLGFGLIFFIINLRRSIRRWMGLRLVNQVHKFKWNATMSAERVKRVNVYTYLEALIMLFFGIGLYQVSHEAWMPMLAMLFGALDNVIFVIFGTAANKFRAGLTTKALIIADRDVIVIYFNGLRKVTPQQQSIYFDFVKDLQLSFPLDCIRVEEQEQFFSTLKSVVNPDKVFFSKKLGE